jgi:heme A synthase
MPQIGLVQVVMGANTKSQIPNPKSPPGRSTGSLIVVVAVLLGIMLGAAVWMLHTRSTRSQTRSALTADERAYLQRIVISDAKVSAATNFLGDMVTYLDAKVTNAGTRSVRQLDLRLEFSDMLNQVVLRDTVHPITPPMPSLNPGETRAFRATFERMPAEWNQAPPTITAVGLHF